jgi:hypothetical protein
MDEAEVRLVEDVVQVVVVVVYLGGRKLSLVDDILRRQRTDVKSFCEGAIPKWY